MKKLALCAFAAVALASLPSAGWAAPQSTIDPQLAKTLRTFKGRSLEIILFLADQPGPVIGRRVRADYEPRLEQVASHLRAIHMLSRPAGSWTEAEEAAAAERLARHGASLEIAALNQQLDVLRNQMLAEIGNELLRAVVPSQQEAIRVIESLGGSVRAKFAVVNGLVATVPVEAIQDLAADGRFALLAQNNPGFPELDISTQAIFANNFWTAGYHGGPYDVGVLDTGVQQNHPAFAGKVFESNAGTTDSNGHGTSMAGIMAGNPTASPQYRGIAWGVDAISVAIAGADATSMSGMNYLMTGPVQRAEAVNYSFGNGTANVNDYAPIDQFFDGVIATFGIMVSKSTGNGGFGTGAPTITHPAPAFNLMATANMDDFNTVSRTADRISSSSSRGPTVGGRKKPDITSPGTNIVSPNRTGGYTGVTGTSPAAPHTGASVVLLLSRGVISQMAAKAILINTADAIDDLGTSSTADDVWVTGSLWNRRYGWGYINLANALLHATDYFTGTFQAPGAGQRRFALYKGTMNNGEKATLTWQRHVAYNGSAYPTLVEALSNLDLVAYLQATNAVHASSVSTIDNVEQIGVSGTQNVVLKVHTTGTFDPQVTSEAYALATEENFTLATGPAFSVVITQQGDFAPGGQGIVEVQVTNIGDLPAHATNLTLAGIIAPGGQTQNLGIVNPGQTKTAVYTVNVPNTPGDHLLFGNVSSNSYGETWTHSGPGSFEVR